MKHLLVCRDCQNFQIQKGPHFKGNLYFLIPLSIIWRRPQIHWVYPRIILSGRRRYINRILLLHYEWIQRVSGDGSAMDDWLLGKKRTSSTRRKKQQHTWIKRKENHDGILNLEQRRWWLMIQIKKLSRNNKRARWKPMGKLFFIEN